MSDTGTLDFDTVAVSTTEGKLSLENGHITESPSKQKSLRGQK